METLNNHADSPTVEGRYRLLVESINDYAIYMLDPIGRVVNWNAGAQRFKGYTADEIVGQHFSRFYTEEDRLHGIPGRNLALATAEGRFEEEGWRVRKDGSRFWAGVVIDRIVDKSGELIGFAKITRDLTERREQELALRRSQEQFRLLVKGVTDYALYMLDQGGCVASWNAGAERIKGYAEEEIVGQHFSVFYEAPEREAGEPERNLDIARRSGRVEREGWRVRKNGTRFWAHVIIDALHDENGKLIGFAKVTRDITERREAQRQLDLAREALFQSQKLEAIGQLTGGVAHDFNNLLMAVLGSLEIVKNRMDSDPRVSPFIENAIQAARRGAGLTQRMLAFARRQELKIGPVDLLHTVHGMTEILGRALGPSAIVTTRFPLSLPSVETDAAQLESALLNLAVNARDAMPGGGPIVIAAKSQVVVEDSVVELQPGHYVVLSVVDTGEGMDAETLARATEPFFTTKGVGKGTGLGLSMVHGLAQQSGGAFVLKSVKGHGTTAELWLPVSADQANRPEPPEATAAVADSPLRRVLVVDDDPLVLLNTVTMAEEMGHQVFQASSAKEALSILEAEHVDLVVTDHAMPRMTGGELAEVLQQRFPTVKVLISTGYAEMPQEYKGRFERLSKPFSYGDLHAAIERAARRRPEAPAIRD